MPSAPPAPAVTLSYRQFETIAPDGVAALLAMGKAVDDSGLEKPLTELVKLRVSQITGCAFCTELHVRVARRVGVEASKLDLLAAWRDAPVYTARERAALSWAEHVTAAPTAPPPHTVHAALAAAFEEHEIVHLTLTVATINAWNRIAGALHFPPTVQP
ncbi:carboxymuconolactone decarboxylase family protein [Roseospira marina]|uniref:Carboxymuconolactone decarboxylase family protein n=1 Tax=Roseospira marina TaxID=140057 RepID=A0A5M6ICS1_9PROT|nr:carboxymuconolactone decarboxylase family protein [Roseospira marina]KAA5605535.1 carboxymuconolactone decarboxylase family protein [Roseospira marina]MBB4313406.1 AhpD family alkylhydroperoxidase [Roseospira marina]MBB5085853.1 AhpD family alkylhydroperoxidase [Roseospira marina]